LRIDEALALTPEHFDTKNARARIPTPNLPPCRARMIAAVPFARDTTF
jgi:hypothetical protein